MQQQLMAAIKGVQKHTQNDPRTVLPEVRGGVVRIPVPKDRVPPEVRGGIVRIQIPMVQVPNGKAVVTIMVQARSNQSQTRGEQL